MAVIKCGGLILSESPAKESDKVLKVFTKEFGKIRVYARGAKKIKSKFFGAARQFNYCEFVLYGGAEFYSLTQIEKLWSFNGASDDYDKLCYGSYFVELADKALYDHEPNQDVLKLLLTALKAVDTGFSDMPAAARAFEFKLMQIAGYMPNMDYCTYCGKGLSGDKLFFGSTGLVCNVCKDYQIPNVIINEAAVQAIKYISENDINRIFSIKLSGNTAFSLKRASSILLLNLEAEIISSQLIN